MNKYTLINIKANLNSCLSIGVNIAVSKLIELCIHRIDEMLETEEVSHSTTSDPRDYGLCPSCEQADTECMC